MHCECAVIRVRFLYANKKKKRLKKPKNTLCFNCLGGDDKCSFSSAHSEEENLQVPGAACKYRPKTSQAINYTQTAFSIQICSFIPYGVHLQEPRVNCFKPSPSGYTLPGIHSPVVGRDTSTSIPQLPHSPPSLPGAC